MDELFSTFDLSKTNNVKRNVNNVVEENLPKKIECEISDDENNDENEEKYIESTITRQISSGITSRIINEDIEIEDTDLEPGNIRNNILKILRKKFLFKVINNVMIIEFELLDNVFNLCYDRDEIFKSINVTMRVKEKYYCVGEEIECSFDVIDNCLIGKTKDIICTLSYAGIINQKINNIYILIDSKKTFTINDKIKVTITKIPPSGHCDYFLVEGKIIDIM